MDIAQYLQAYKQGECSPADLMEKRLGEIAADTTASWINPCEDAVSRAQNLGEPDDRPLYGIPFAVKDNIDVAGTPTTAACPAYSYTPDANAFVIDRLIAAGFVLGSWVFAL